MNIIVGAGALVATGAITLALVKQRRLGLWQRTTGRVCDLVRRHNHEERRPTTTFAPVVSFKTEQGEEVTFISSVSTSYPPEVGETVPVVFNPANPKDALINRWPSLFLAELIGLVFGLAAVGVGLVIGG